MPDRPTPNSENAADSTEPSGWHKATTLFVDAIWGSLPPFLSYRPAPFFSQLSCGSAGANRSDTSSSDGIPMLHRSNAEDAVMEGRPFVLFSSIASQPIRNGAEQRCLTPSG